MSSVVTFLHLAGLVLGPTLHEYPPLLRSRSGILTSAAYAITLPSIPFLVMALGRHSTILTWPRVRRSSTPECALKGPIALLAAVETLDQVPLAIDSRVVLPTSPAVEVSLLSLIAPHSWSHC